MARPPLPIGSHGQIFTKRESAEGIKPEKWRASTRFRDADGKTRQVERWGTSENKAKAELRAALRERVGVRGIHLSSSSRFEDAAKLWIERVKVQLRATTHDTYRSYLNTLVLPAVGQLLLRECTAGRLQDVMDELERQGRAANTRRGVRKVLVGVMQVAVRKEILEHNPAKHLEQIKGEGSKPKAYDADELRAFLAKLDADNVAVRTGLAALLRFQFGTGVRIGEALALRWCDVNLSDLKVKAYDSEVGEQVIPPRSLWINGNLVPVRGEGVRRHSGKTFAARRVLAMPDFLHTMLLVMRPIDAADDEPVFPSESGGWRHPSNVQKAVRRLRDRMGEGYEDFTTHLTRKTVASALDGDRRTAREIADQLGQSNVAVAQNVYLGRGRVNPEAAAVINAFHRPAGDASP